MEFKTMTVEELELRMDEIATEIDNEDANLDELEQEAKGIKAELEERKKVEIAKAEIRTAVADGKVGKVVKTIEVEEKKEMTMNEVRNSQEYIEAFAKYIKTGKDAEVRALLTENVTSGTVPVPEMVENRIRQAWENDEIFSRVTKTFVRGNLKVGFEISATDAAVHVEGTDAPTEETLVLGIVNLVPETIKKWITFSTEVMALGAEDFLAYIYDELTYKIIQKAADIVITKIVNAPATSTATQVGVAKINEVGTYEGVIDALAELGDSARDIVFIANGKTIADYRKLALGFAYPIDMFQGMTVIKNSNMTDGTVVIGDLSGVQANLPEGDSVRFVFDEYSLAEKDLVKLVGRLYAAIGVVTPKMFAVITAGA